MLKKKKKAPPELIHEHFILDAELKGPLDFEKRQEITTKLIKQLMKNLGMEELGPLEIYDATDADYPGWSFIQPITTSHISGHYFEEKGKPSHIHMDIYSCKSFEWEKIIKILSKNLKLNDWSATFLKREMNMKNRIASQFSGKDTKIAKTANQTK